MTHSLIIDPVKATSRYGSFEVILKEKVINVHAPNKMSHGHLVIAALVMIICLGRNINNMPHVQMHA